MRAALASVLTLGVVLARASAAPPAASAYVDGEGVLRWSAGGREITQFGVNYTAPFAFSFRAHARLGVPITTAIDADTYHMARLGLDAYRVHVWDRQISDAEGNVLANEHLAALDYLLWRLEQRGVKIVLTPLQFGDAGYPEAGAGVDSGAGFSGRYGKAGCLQDRASWPLQERYLAQFVSHVNARTGVALKDDPNIVGFEICNEPGHFEYAPTVEYINTMIGAIRGAGCAKPLFYNMSHGLPVAQAYLDSQAQGGTFQWYPSGLVAGHEQWGNFLPYVDDYPIPFAANPKFRTKAKIVYEFDTADIGRTYLYPAIARSFRKAGVQFATQFAYDPLYLAPSNTEYQTHYLNLAYAPQKALSLMVAAEAFRRVPRFKRYGAYPADTSFEGVRLSYAEDLAELATAEKFLYTNDTSTPPPAPAELRQVAGFGHSPVVDYPGRGAYFLDRLEPGVWRLEVMPDAVWVSDPFAKASPEKVVCRIAWNEWPMRIELPDLGTDFGAVGLNDGNSFSGQAAGATLAVRPGAYLLSRRGLRPKWKPSDRWGNITLKEFVAPPASADRAYVVHEVLPEASAGRDLRLKATVIGPEANPRVTLVAYLPRDPAPPPPENPRQQPGGSGPPPPPPVALAMAPSGLDYSVVISGGKIRPGTLRYFILVQNSARTTTFPSQFPGRPTDWDFFGAAWQTRIVAAGSPVLLFDAAADSERITYQVRERHYRIVPADQPGSSALEMTAPELDRGEHDESFRFFFAHQTAGRSSDLAAGRTLVLCGRSATGAACPMQLALVTADGIAYGATVSVGPGFGRYSVPVSALAQVRSPNIPHGYPVFLHFWSSAPPTPLVLGRAESVLVSIGPGMAPAAYPQEHRIEIERIWLE
ncbi:MAG TPA: hypothetical protein VHV47_12410 [Opitutaceae bacterium]|nr:hypothetical protein [Opitutaceae bacterium]